MSTQDKMERILKRIHVILSEGETDSEDPDKVTIDKKQMISILEKLNVAIYEMMEQYEATTQSREMAERRSEKKGQEMIERVSRQADDIYAASLIYTEDALQKVQMLMTNAMANTQAMWTQFQQEMEQEKARVKEDQQELQEQLRDFKESNKYLDMIEACNKEREEQTKEAKAPEKKIQNEAKHYAMNPKPEIKVNPAYFQRRGLTPEGTAADAAVTKDTAPVIKKQSEVIEDIPPMPKKFQPVGDIPPMPVNLQEEEQKPFVMPEIKVDLDAEYFKWQEEEKGGNHAATEKGSVPGKKEWKGLFGKK